MHLNGYTTYLFGCSHTANIQSECYELIEQRFNCKVNPYCVGGNSNDKIIREIKNLLFKLTNGFTKKVNRIYFNIQFTYLNRIEFYSDLENKYIPFHSKNIMDQPFGTNVDDFNVIYNKFYTDWVTYFFNEKNRLKTLIEECYILKTLMEEWGIKYTWYLWSGINTIELNTEKNLKSENYVFEEDFKKLGFTSLDNFWYIEDYAKKYKMRYIDNPNLPKDEHLTKESNKILLEFIVDWFNKKRKNEN